MIDSGSQNNSHTWFDFRGISKEENPKMRPKVRFCGLTSGFTLLIKWKKISYALKLFKHIFRIYCARYTKETKTTFKTACDPEMCEMLASMIIATLTNRKILLCVYCGFWVTYTNNGCDVCQRFCLSQHWKFMNTLCNMFCLYYRTMKKKTQLLQKLLMKTMIFLP